ncbi:heme/hemin ABC transporter substrate-binding protein [Rothia nasimurium]|uniref:heme/hemin ABC transporter substrate-binding protein n=1 Tax=Rothia nasimurium TaxID=85336 RepID=UPI001F36EE5A|nr:ABC transporter substrate-binding protein [Rothia nasimurium]
MFGFPCFSVFSAGRRSLPVVSGAVLAALVLSSCAGGGSVSEAGASSASPSPAASQVAAASTSEAPASAAPAESAQATAGGIAPVENEQVHRTALQEAEDRLRAQAVADPKALTGLATAASVPDVLPLENPQAPQLPVTVTDFQGTEVTVTSADRILALDMYGTLAQTVLALGLGDNLVGRVTSSTETALADLPLVTENGHDISAEAVLSLAPTVVLMDTTNGPLEITEQLRSAGVTVVHFDPARSLDQVVPQIHAVAAALGVEDAGARLGERVQAEIDSALATIAEVAPQDPAQKVGMAFLYVRGTAGVFFILGDGTGADELITALGGRDVASEGGASGTIPANAEALVRANPELILTMTGGVQSTGGIEGFFARPGVAETTAGANQRVVDMADGQILSFGPNSAAVLLSLATAIYTQQ